MQSKETFSCVRERVCAQEERFLSPYAMRSSQTQGREREEKRCDFRTDFQRDRDRIIYSNSFKRLKNKTQVFFAPEGDHYITRLTHTLDVSQIARSIARSLALNEDLEVEPRSELFPHAEAVLRRAMERGCKNFIYTNRGSFLYRYLEFFGISDCFADCVISAKKPDPQSLLDMLEKHGIDPAEAVVVGDRALDVEGGFRAGVDGILFNPIGRVKEHCAKHVITDLSELYDFIP